MFDGVHCFVRMFLTCLITIKTKLDYYLQYPQLTGQVLTYSVDFVADLAGNLLEAPATWSVRVNAAACGHAVFSGLDPASMTTLAISSKTPFTDGAVSISISNPDQTRSWVGNSQIKSVSLLYRRADSVQWLPAHDKTSAPVEFFDDVRTILE